MTAARVIPRGEAAARFAKAHQVSLAAAAEHFNVSRERARQKWRDLFGDAPTPRQAARGARDGKIVDLASRGLTASEIALKLDLSPDLVRRARDREGIAMVNGNEKVAVTDETKARIVALARSGKGRAEIAHETGASYAVVTKYLKGLSTNGQRGRRSVAQDSRSGRCAMASDVMDRTGCSLTEAAAMFVVPPPAVYGYRKRRGLWTTRR